MGQLTSFSGHGSHSPKGLQTRSEAGCATYSGFVPGRLGLNPILPPSSCASLLSNPVDELSSFGSLLLSSREAVCVRKTTRLVEAEVASAARSRVRTRSTSDHLRIGRQ
jgi:hypothetical protein